MRKVLFLLAAMAIGLQLWAAPVDPATAQTKAQQYLKNSVYAGKIMAPSATEATLIKTVNGEKAITPVYYIFNTSTTFVIVSGDDRAEEILAYGDKPLNLDRIPKNMQVWLDSYKEQLDWLLTHPEAKVDKPSTYRSASIKDNTVIGPLLTAIWDQTAPFWNQCKFVYNGTTYQCYTGCPATSASMVLYHWKYPIGPTGEVPAYTSVLELTYSWWGGGEDYTYAALPSVTFDWDNMIDDYTGGYTTAQGDAVATLMRYVGQAEKMMYGTASAGGSGISSDNVQDIVDMFTFFGYDETTCRLVQKKNGYSNAQWGELIQNEMAEGRPIVFCAIDNGGAGGHAFNVDGYDAVNNKYHINFGWSGDGNNWCALNAFADGDGYNFSTDQQMVIGIQPPYATMRVSPSELSFDGFAGNTYTKTFSVKGYNLDGPISIAVSGDDVYSVDLTAISETAAAGGVDVTVTYAPVEAGNTSATITLTSENAEPIEVPITGVARPRVPTLMVSPETLVYSTKLDFTMTKTIDLTGVFLEDDVTVTLDDPSGVFTVSPATIEASSLSEDTPVQVTVTFNSAVEGNFTGLVTFASQGAESKTVAITADARDTGTASDPYLNIAYYPTIDDAGATVSGMSSIYKYTEYAADNCGWLTVSNYGAMMADAKQNWIKVEGTKKNSGTWDASDIFLGSSSYFTGTAYYTDWDEKYQTFYVTNCTQVKQYSYNANSNRYPVVMTIFECSFNDDGSLNPSTEPVYTVKSQTKGNEVITSPTLDARKIYMVKIFNDNSRLFEIAFQTPLSAITTPVATEATEVGADKFTANWNGCAGATSYTLRVMAQPAAYMLLLTEGFSKFNSIGGADVGNNLDRYMDNPGWTGHKLYQAVGGVRMGTSSETGTLTSPELDLSQSHGKMSIKLKANTYNTDANCGLAISCGEASDTITLPNSTEAEYMIVLDCEELEGQKVSFASTVGGKRVVIKGLEIYSGEYKDEETSTDAPILFTGITETSYTVTGLEPGYTYFYDVKAIFESTESNWSNQISVTTLTNVYGDVNCDGVVNAGDVSALYGYILDNNMTYVETSDVNGDGVINAADVTVLYNLILGITEDE